MTHLFTHVYCIYTYGIEYIYANILGYIHTSDNHLDKIIKLNKKVLRISQFSKLRSYTDVLYMNYNILPIFLNYL
jgi:hypothetical protein